MEDPLRRQRAQRLRRGRRGRHPARPGRCPVVSVPAEVQRHHTLRPPRHRLRTPLLTMAPGVGIKEVARAAGVSVGTVSNVINRPESVSEATRDRVQAVIERLGY
ncbi:LacI family DNA-binding transcriptional regulator, partial [Streptomyces sp. MnatMP-M27]|uniref:LacI family DNA-binding transcriptional regulator n=1 Tax=Streptomyces sp. MnatMP-M27 TaxID=1839768 RepID=UPI00351DBCE4